MNFYTRHTISKNLSATKIMSKRRIFEIVRNNKAEVDVLLTAEDWKYLLPQPLIRVLKAPTVCDSNKIENRVGSGSKYFQTSAVSSTPTSVLLMQNISNISILDILFYAVVKQRSKSAKKKVTLEKMREEKY